MEINLTDSHLSDFFKLKSVTSQNLVSHHCSGMISVVNVTIVAVCEMVFL